MKIQIPDELKADLPQTKWGKMFSVTPIVMTVIATLLAGLASSEMTRAQYDRALAAQQQSKAGDQWSFFQAKKLRGAMQRSTLDLLQSTTELRPLDAAALPATVSEPALLALKKGELPALPPAPPMDAAVQAAFEAIASSRPEHEISNLLVLVKNQNLDQALQDARDQTLAFDAALQPISLAIAGLEKNLVKPTGSDSAARSLVRDFTAARLRYTAAHYDAEARLNQRVAHLLELQVRKSNRSAERHHARSGRFFFGMLAAQMGVVISTLAMAARQKNLLWSLAATAGLAAISFALYVFLYV